MAKIIQQEDHLILPYSTLKRFMDEKNEISVFDFNNLYSVCVNKRRPKSFHTEENYFNPEYDDEVKKRERLIGILYAKLSKAVAEIESGSAPSVAFNKEELKKQIIDLATIEISRLTIVDDRRVFFKI